MEENREKNNKKIENEKRLEQDLRQNIDVIEMIKSIQNMDSQTKKMISETIQVLFKCIQNEIKRGN